MATSNSISAAVEDYAKAIYVLQGEAGGAISNNALAERLGVTPASASAMVKKLDGLGLEMAEEASATLDSLATGARGCFTRISDHDSEMLRYLAERGIKPGDAFEVVDKQPFGGPLFVRFGDDVHVVGGGLAGAMRVE